MKKVELMIVSCMAVGAAVLSLADEPLSDGALREKIVSFVMLPGRLCGHAVVDFRNELRERKLTNRDWFDGDTNRLARIIAEIAQTNDVEIASMMIGELGKYGTYAQLPVLYSCATNPVVGDRAIRSIFAIEGVTSNSVGVAQSYLLLTNETVLVDRGGATVCSELVRCAMKAEVDATCRTNALAVANEFATTRNRNYYWLDHLLMQNDESYRHSKRRLRVLRSADILHCPYPYQVNYVTNAINELVAYPEVNLPD